MFRLLSSHPPPSFPPADLYHPFLLFPSKNSEGFSDLDFFPPELVAMHLRGARFRLSWQRKKPSLSLSAISPSNFLNFDSLILLTVLLLPSQTEERAESLLFPSLWGLELWHSFSFLPPPPRVWNKRGGVLCLSPSSFFQPRPPLHKRSSENGKEGNAVKCSCSPRVIFGWDCVGKKGRRRRRSSVGGGDDGKEVFFCFLGCIFLVTHVRPSYTRFVIHRFVCCRRFYFKEAKRFGENRRGGIYLQLIIKLLSPPLPYFIKQKK